MNKDWSGSRDSMEDIIVRGSNKNKGLVVCGGGGLGWVKDETVALKGM